MRLTFLRGAALAALLAPGPLVAQPAEGQDPLRAEMEAMAAMLGNTSLTVRSHSIPANGQVNSAEGGSCPTATTMLSGACHPGFSDQMILVNQYPNIAARTWRCGFRNNSGAAQTAWIYTLCAADAPTTPPPVVKSLSVARYTTTPLTNADTDRILTDASRVARTADFPGDVACNVELRRSGNVAAFTTGDGSIDSSGEFSAVIGVPGWVKAVNQINWCGSIAAGIIGCAPVPGSSLAVVRFNASLEGILWLHEYAHNKGRSHRNGTQNVMHPSIGSDRLGLDQAECDALKAAPVVAAQGAPMADVAPAAGGEPPAGVALPGTGGAGEPPADIRDFIRVHYIEGLPVTEALTYGPEDASAVLQILQDEAQSEWWVNAVAVLGIIGGEDAFDELVAFLEEAGDEQLPPDVYRAKATVPLALGYMANLTGSQQAVSYLVEGAQASFWEDSGVGRAEFQPSTEARNEDLADKFKLGLALAATDEAIAALEGMAEDQPAAAEGPGGTLIEDALQTARRIQEVGLEQYYEDSGR
jgi:hypothetical protein